mmetsp:Transcript_109056/g.307403  ORF Transcript_109056/g.307403 Transcript_109056/m.307403 type:complete len:372 (+) Transcript_109056:106-1221(+)
MAPTKKAAAKRSASEQRKAPRAPSPKKVRLDPGVAAVMAVIKGAKHLPVSCRDMLIAMLPHSLCVAVEERQKAQAAIVRQVGEVFDHACDERRRAIRAADATISELQAASSKAETWAEEQAAKKAAAAEKTSRLKQESAEAARAKTAAEEALAKALEAERETSAALAAIQVDKDAIDAALDVSSKALEDEALDADASAGHIAVLEPIAVKWSLDESLVAALPSVGAKSRSERTSFDIMVLEQVRTSFAEVAQRLVGKLEAGASAAAERAVAIGAAQQALQAAADAEQEKAVDVSNAQAAEQEAAMAAREAMNEVADAKASVGKARIARDALQLECDGFHEASFARFVELRDKTAKVLAMTGAMAEPGVGGA